MSTRGQETLEMQRKFDILVYRAIILVEEMISQKEKAPKNFIQSLRDLMEGNKILALVVKDEFDSYEYLEQVQIAVMMDEGNAVLKRLESIVDQVL